MAFDNSCLVLSSRREDDNDRKGFQGEHENGKDEKKDGKTQAFIRLSILDSRSSGSGFKRPDLLGIAIAYYIHVLYRSR